MVSPLGLKFRRETNKRVQSLTDNASQLPMSESHGLWYFNQWTLEMGGKCYKLSPKDLKFKSINDIWYICRQLESDAENWHKERLEYGFKQETRKVGQTRMMPKEIMTKGKYRYR